MIKENTNELSNNFTLSSITIENVNSLKLLNRSVFPVSYNEKFYKDVIYSNSKLLSLLATTEDGQAIGAICCRIEQMSDNTRRVYIMTLGVLQSFRRLKVASLLLSTIIDNVITHLLSIGSNSESIGFLKSQLSPINCMSLHVHVLNTAAIEFYTKKFGFCKKNLVAGYYATNLGVEPPDAFLLEKKL